MSITTSGFINGREGIKLADPITMMLVGSTALQVHGAIQEGQAAEKAGKFKAKTQMAAGTRRAAEHKRAGDIVASDARAAMAASGGSASDAGAVETLGKIKAETDYNVLSALYEGEQAADISRYEGKIKKKAAYTRGLSTALSGGAKAFRSYNKYSGGRKPAKSTLESDEEYEDFEEEDIGSGYGDNETDYDDDDLEEEVRSTVLKKISKRKKLAAKRRRANVLYT